MCDVHCLKCYSNVKRRANYRGHRGYRAPPRVEWSVRRPYVKKPEVGGDAYIPTVEFSDDAFRARFPTLYEYLTCSEWEDGSHRETATLLLFLDSGVLKACINDRAMGRNMFVAGSSLQGALAAAEEALRSENPGWRVFKAQVQTKGRKKG